jgi:hypothetical protein
MMSQQQEKPSALKREHLALQKMKFINCFSTFLGHSFPYGSGSRDPIESRSNLIRDPQDFKDQLLVSENINLVTSKVFFTDKYVLLISYLIVAPLSALSVNLLSLRFVLDQYPHFLQMNIT